MMTMKKRNYAFYPVRNKEGKEINTDNDLELAFILKMKEENRPQVLKNIDYIIDKKHQIISNPIPAKSVCFVGHSQLDQWEIDEISGYKVRNCAVSGISSFEYEEKILTTRLLNCEADWFIVMHGTNDIVWDYTIDEIVTSIKHTISYIKERTDAPIIFLSCIHVNGRLDRNNNRIDELNLKLRAEIGSNVEWVDTSFLDDNNGMLNKEYTKDGLHISDKGYEALLTEIVKTVKRIGL